MAYLMAQRFSKPLASGIAGKRRSHIYYDKWKKEAFRSGY